MKTEVKCPKCGKSFEYNFVPGASFTAIRLGNYRYMRCRKCGKWALFNVTGNLSAAQKKNLGAMSIIMGVLIAILGAIVLIKNILMHNGPIEIVGVFILAISFLMIISGLAAFKNSNK